MNDSTKEKTTDSSAPCMIAFVVAKQEPIGYRVEMARMRSEGGKLHKRSVMLKPNLQQCDLLAPRICEVNDFLRGCVLYAWSPRSLCALLAPILYSSKSNHDVSDKLMQSLAGAISAESISEPLLEGFSGSEKQAFGRVLSLLGLPNSGSHAGESITPAKLAAVFNKLDKKPVSEVVHLPCSEALQESGGFDAPGKRSAKRQCEMRLGSPKAEEHEWMEIREIMEYLADPHPIEDAPEVLGDGDSGEKVRWNGSSVDVVPEPWEDIDDAATQREESLTEAKAKAHAGNIDLVAFMRANILIEEEIAKERTAREAEAAKCNVEIFSEDVQACIKERFKESGKRRGLKLGTKVWREVPAPEPILQLAEKFPSFSEPIKEIAGRVAMAKGVEAKTGRRGLKLPNILLVGEPGLGKTRFLMELAETLKTRLEIIPMSTTTGGFVLSGSSDTWKSAKPGKIFETIASVDYPNPMVMLDEIDKTGANMQYDPLGPLYGLLERKSAERFLDEFLDCEFDASHINFIASANSVAAMSSAILSRFRIFEIPSLTPIQARQVAASVHSSLLKDEGWIELMDVELPEPVIDRLASMSPRAMKAALSSAIPAAFGAGRSSLQLADFGPVSTKKRAIGF